MSLRSRLSHAFIRFAWRHSMTCMEVTRLASLRLERPLSLKIRAKLRLHFLICVFCHHYVKQLEQIHQHAPKYNQHLESAPAPELSPEAGNRIKARLEKAMQE